MNTEQNTPKPTRQKTPTAQEVLSKYEKAFEFKNRINLFDTVRVNEDFFIGKQWEGVEANGLPTPTFNVLKQVVNFQVSTITSDNMVLQASPLSSVSSIPSRQLERICKVVNRQYAAIIERNRIVAKMREFLRNAAVDGDGCMYFYFDPSIENGQLVKGEIVAEIIQNTRVHFGNPNCRDVQQQPWIIVSRRRLVEDVRFEAEQLKAAGQCDIEDPDAIAADDEKFDNKLDSYTDDKVTVLSYFYRSRDTKTIWCMEATAAGTLRKAYDTKLKRYPFVWMSWDWVQDCYHGQAMITGLLPNQKFINKLFALVGISLLTTAFPKVIYDRTRIRSWDGSVGSAVGVSGNVDNVAKVIDGAAVNPQITQYIELCMDKTKSLLGASDVAMGDSRPDNTSAIIALQRAANTPMEMTKQSMYQCVEDMGLIWVDIMASKYGTRKVEMEMELDDAGSQPLNMGLQDMEFVQPFDFSVLADIPLAIRQDAGASSYWSEIASMQTIDNLLINGKITLLQYLERVPSGYIVDKQKLIDELKAQTLPAPPPAATGVSKNNNPDSIPVQGGSGNGQLQRALNNAGV